jgi:hypothetical protein
MRQFVARGDRTQESRQYGALRRRDAIGSPRERSEHVSTGLESARRDPFHEDQGVWLDSSDMYVLHPLGASNFPMGSVSSSVFLYPMSTRIRIATNKACSSMQERQNVRDAPSGRTARRHAGTAPMPREEQT